MFSVFAIDWRYFLRNGAFVTVGHFFEAILAFLVLWALSRWVDKDSFGTYSYVLSFITFLSVFSLPGLVQALACAPLSKNRLRTFLIKSFRWSLLGSLILILLAVYYALLSNSELVFLFLLSALAFPFLYSFSNVSGAYFLREKRFMDNAVYSVLKALFNTVFVLMAAFLFGETSGLLGAFLVTTLVGNAAIYFLVERHLKKAAENREEDKEISNYAGFLSKMSVLTLAATQVDQLVLGLLLTPAAVADYRVLASLTNTVKNLEKSAGLVLFPKFLDYPEEELVRKRPHHLLLLLMAGALVTALGIFFQPWFIRLFFGDVYVGVLPLAQIMVLTLLFIPIEVYFLQFFYSRKKEASYMKLIVFISTAKLVLTLLSFWLWGFFGVVLSNVFSRGFNLLFVLFLKNEPAPRLQP